MEGGRRPTAGEVARQVRGAAFEDLDEVETTATTKWAKRCYFLNSKRMKYQDDGMQVVTPVRPYNILAMYQMCIVRSVLTMSQRNAHAVMSIA